MTSHLRRRTFFLRPVAMRQPMWRVRSKINVASFPLRPIPQNKTKQKKMAPSCQVSKLLASIADFSSLIILVSCLKKEINERVLLRQSQMEQQSYEVPNDQTCTRLKKSRVGPILMEWALSLRPTPTGTSHFFKMTSTMSFASSKEFASRPPRSPPTPCSVHDRG